MLVRAHACLCEFAKHFVSFRLASANIYEYLVRMVVLMVRACVSRVSSNRCQMGWTDGVCVCVCVCFLSAFLPSSMTNVFASLRSGLHPGGMVLLCCEFDY